jgi:hypothetical protein
MVREREEPSLVVVLVLAGRRIPQDSLNPIIGLTHCDILPCFISYNCREFPDAIETD